MAEADGHLRQKLQQVLKLSKEKWDDARDHAMRAVVADNRMRIWYADKANMEVGLLFTCRLGNVDLDRPVGRLLPQHPDVPFSALSDYICSIVCTFICSFHQTKQTDCPAACCCSV